MSRNDERDCGRFKNRWLFHQMDGLWVDLCQQVPHLSLSLFFLSLSSDRKHVRPQYAPTSLLAAAFPLASISDHFLFDDGEIDF